MYKKLTEHELRVKITKLENNISNLNRQLLNLQADLKKKICRKTTIIGKNMKAEDYLGLPKKAAQNKAEAGNLIFRLIRVDDKPFFDYPEDKRDDRVCVEVEAGKVVKVTFQ